MRARAWNAVIRRYKVGRGDKAVQEALIVDAMTRGTFSLREATDAYGAAGTDLDLILGVFGRAGAIDKGFMAADVASVARRVDRRDDARVVLEAARDQAGANFVLKKALNKAIESL